VSLTWTDSTETNIRARACISAGDTTQTDNANVALSVAVISVAITPTSSVQGGTLTATYTGYTSGAVWLCYQSGTSIVGTSPSCAAPGSASSITTADSGSGVVCTESQTSGAVVPLTWTDSTETNIRARACISAGDTTQTDNANVALTVAGNNNSTGAVVVNNHEVTTTLTLAGIVLTAFDTDARNAFKEVVADYLKICGADGTSQCTASDVTIVSASRRDVKIKFSVKTFSAETAQVGVTTLTAKIGTPDKPVSSFLTDLKAKSSLSSVTSTSVTTAPEAVKPTDPEEISAACSISQFSCVALLSYAIVFLA